MSTLVRNAEEKVQKERKLNLLVLVREFLADEGYVDTLKSFEAETRLSKDNVLCDNVDIGTIVEDFTSYYFLRFKKYPKISRKVSFPCDNSETKTKEKRKTFVAKQKPEQPRMSSVNNVSNDWLVVESICAQGDNNKVDRLWRGLGSYDGFSEEWKAFADIISREVIDRDLNVKWDSVVGLEEAKQHLREAIVYPMKYPELFAGSVLSPWKGLLLYGPSGTGKTLLAKAVATECSTTFFNISASSLMSKWRGDSEKLVRVMFELARHQAPSTIFIDEVDALASNRDCPTEHEASRRLKSEFLVQLDGLIDSSDNIFLLTTTNLPWDLDPAILRRLEKKIFVDLPDEQARTTLLETFLPPTINQSLQTDVDCVELAKYSKGYSGADIKLVCKEALMAATRNIILSIEKPKSKSAYRRHSTNEVTTSDVLDAFKLIKPIQSDVTKFRNWLK